MSIERNEIRLLKARVKHLESLIDEMKGDIKVLIAAELYDNHRATCPWCGVYKSPRPGCPPFSDEMRERVDAVLAKHEE